MIDCFIGPTRNGNGLFLNTDIIKGTIIMPVIGNMYTVEETEGAGQFSKKAANAYRYNKNHYICCEGGFGDYINHSCNPNAKIVMKNKTLYVVALKNISQQNEILIDYSTIMATDDPWFMECNCGQINCRKIITKFNLLPKEVLDMYLAEGIIPQYILDIK